MAVFELTTTAGEYAQALRNTPALIEQYLKPALDLSAKKMARRAKEVLRANNSIAHSVLINSINSAVASDGLEAIIKPGVRYAQYVEEGGKPGRYPAPQEIIDWIKVKRIQPRNPEMSQEELGFIICRKIALEGTQAKPFMEPAFNLEKDAALNRVNAAIRTAIRRLSA